MITIFKDKKDIPTNMDYVELNDVFFNQTSLKQSQLILGFSRNK